MLWNRKGIVDVRIDQAIISRISSGLEPRDGEAVVEANGCTLLPGLNDHHIHLVALAASLQSLSCGPPDIESEEALSAKLSSLNSDNQSHWLRGIGYHPSVAGEIDRDWLDKCIPNRPVRIQHRGGRLWVLNSRALSELDLPAPNQPAGLEIIQGRITGRLYESDHWLRQRLNSRFPDLTDVSALLASYGITGMTDTTPTNGIDEWQYFRQAQASGQLKQRVRMMGGHQLEACEESGLLKPGEFKIHLLESQLPDHDTMCRDIEIAHKANRAVALHCVTLTELVYAISGLETAGVKEGDRIEHASVTPPDMLNRIHHLGVRVVTQPHFIAERGDQYLTDVETGDIPWLYRCGNFLKAGVPLAAGSDAPFGNADPWCAMKAAVARKTSAGAIIGAGERLNPEQALSLFLSDLDAPGIGVKTLAEGAVADLCLLDSPWVKVREDLDCGHVRCTWRAGEMIYSS